MLYLEWKFTMTMLIWFVSISWKQRYKIVLKNRRYIFLRQHCSVYSTRTQTPKKTSNNNDQTKRNRINGIHIINKLLSSRIFQTCDYIIYTFYCARARMELFFLHSFAFRFNWIKRDYFIRENKNKIMKKCHPRENYLTESLNLIPYLCRKCS